MKKIKKRYNLKIISLLLAALFLLNTTVYGISPSNKVRLRVPITGNNQQLRERLEKAVLASNENIKQEAGYPLSRRDFLSKTVPVAGGLFLVPLPVLGASIESSGPRNVFAGGKDVVKASSPKGFTPAAVVDGIAGPGVKQDNIIEVSLSENRLTDILTNLTDPGKKIIRWRWSKTGESWTAKKWDSGSETRDLSGDDLVFRYVISGTPSAAYDIIFQDNKEQEIKVSSTEHLVTLPAEQYWLVKLDGDLKNRNPAFNWQAVKPPIFRAVTSQADVFIKRIEILNVRDALAEGIPVGEFFCADGDPTGGNVFAFIPGLTGKAIPGGRPPACVLGFTSLLDNPETILGYWQKLPSEPEQVPHEVLEMWLPEGSGKSGIIENDVPKLRKNAAEKKELILSGKGEASSAKAINAQTVFERVNSGEFDIYFRNRALAAKQYGKTVMLRIFHEMMGGWYPWSIWSEKDVEDFIKAWKRIVKIYKDNGATNVAFGLSPHTYEPDYLPQTRKFQVLDHILWHLLNDAEGPMVDFVGINAYSYPPEGGYFNELVTECRETVEKYGIPVIMGETGSAMDETDKRTFWEYKINNLRDGVFEKLPTVIFSINKFENGGMKNFHPPDDLMEQLEKENFFGGAYNAFKDLPGSGDKYVKKGIPEPLLPQSTSSIASWVNENTNQRFTMIPGKEIEECFWAQWDGAWRGNGFSVSNPELNASNFSEFELAMPMEIIKGDFNFFIEDSDFGVGFVGNQIMLTKDILAKYIVDGKLIIALSEINTLGKKLQGEFDWGGLFQIKFELLGDRGKILRGKPVIRKKLATAVEDVVMSGKKQNGKIEAGELIDSYPNPFGAAGTTIRYTINKPSQNVSIQIFDLQGRLIRVLSNVEGGVGPHAIKWDGLNDNRSVVSRQEYLIRIIIDGKPSNTIESLKLGTLGLLIHEIKGLLKDL